MLWDWVAGNEGWVADVGLGILNLALLIMVFIESRKTRNISQRLTTIEENRDKALLEFDAAAESKTFKPDDGDIWVFVRIVNRGGRDSVLWPSKSGVFGIDDEGNEIRLHFEIWATDELQHRNWIQTNTLRATLDATPGARRERDAEDYNVRAGQMREFYFRIFAQTPLDLVRGNQIRVVAAPVLGAPTGIDVTLVSLEEAKQFVKRKGQITAAADIRPNRAA